jgi:hypothetical protein
MKLFYFYSIIDLKIIIPKPLGSIDLVIIQFFKYLATRDKKRTF